MLENPQKEEGVFFSLIKTTHHGVKCEKCGKNPITGYRYKCSVCPNFNLCQDCEQKNAASLEHNHNFIKMREEEKKPKINPEIKEIKKEEKKNNPPKQEIININKVNEKEKKEYNYEIPPNNINELNKDAIEAQDKEVKYKIQLLNNSDLEWPEKKTKLIIDKNSEIKHNEIILDRVPPQNAQIIEITLNIDNLEEGNKKCIFNFNVDGKNYGKQLILNVNIKEHEKVKQLRDEFKLSKNEYDSKRLLSAINKVNGDINKAFESLFV